MCICPWAGKCVWNMPAYLILVCLIFNTLYTNHSYFLSFKLLPCFCSENLLKLYQIDAPFLFAWKALKCCCITFHHKTIIPTSNACLASVLKSSNFSSSLKTILKTRIINKFSYSFTTSRNDSNSTASVLLNCWWSSFSWNSYQNISTVTDEGRGHTLG